MRNFKTIVVTILLLILAGVALVAIKSFISVPSGPGETLPHDDEGVIDLDDIYSQQMKQVEGTVKVLGVSLYGEGTHRLEKDNVLVMVLEGEDVSLPDYEGKDVRVRGIVRDTVSGGQKIMKVQYIEPLVESGSKIFNEVGYEFSFSYPSEWEVKKEQDKVSYLMKKGDESETLMIVYQFENVPQPLEVWLKDLDQNLFFQEVQVKVGSVTGVRRTVENGDQKIIKTYVKEGKNAYEIRLISQDEVVKNQYFSLVDDFKTSFSGIDEETAELDEEEDDSINSEDEELATETPETSSDDSIEQSLTSLPPLSTADIEKVVQKGFASFAGRTITFDYPKSWYFSYLGDGKYGITDDVSYADAQQQVTEEVSRLLLVSGELKTTCVEAETKTVESVEYTVCAREPGLQSIVDHITESIAKTEPKTE